MSGHGLGEITVLSPDESAERGRERLARLAKDCQALVRAVHSAGLQLGANLYEVQRYNLYAYDPRYEEGDRTPQGALAATATWAARELGLTYSRVGQLIDAHRAQKAVSTRVETDLGPTSEAQLRPLVPLLSEPSTAKKIPEIWGRAVETTKREQPSMADVKKAAREIVPEAFAVKKKPKSRSKEKAGRAVDRLLEQFDRKTLAAVLAAKGLK